jgi:hypothetical protein
MSESHRPHSVHSRIARPLIARAAVSVAALALLALSGCVAYPYGYGGYGYGYGYAPGYVAPAVVVGGGYGGWRGRWR